MVGQAPFGLPGGATSWCPVIFRRSHERTFSGCSLIEELVKWENTNNEDVLNAARLEIARSVARQKGVELPAGRAPEKVNAFLAEHAPPVMDPFAGGGSIPLEAQRLGLKAYAGDLNPVAVLINKALIELPPRFANLPPVNPESRRQIGGTENWRGAAGLAEDIRYYGRLVRDMAYEKIGHLYPKVQLPPAYGGGEASVIAWLWARTVKCPNPACGAQMPLVRSFWLSKKKGKETWVDPVVDKTISPPKVSFEVRAGKGKALDGTVNRRGAVCLCCDTPVAFDVGPKKGEPGACRHSNGGGAEGNMAGCIFHQQGSGCYCFKDKPKWRPEAALPHNPRDFKTPNYGINTLLIYSPRQLVALTTFSS